MEIFKLMGTVAINKDQALKDIKAVQDQAQRASTEMGRSFTKFTTDHAAQFRKMGMVATVVGGVITFAVKKMGDSFDKYETALVDMGKITDESLESIENRMKELPPILGNLTELTQGYYQIVSAGIRDPIEAVDTLTVSAQTAAAAHMNQSEVVKGLTKVMAGYQGAIGDVSEAADLMFAIEKEGQTTVAELIPLIGGLATMSSNLKISQDEMGASFAVITRTAGSSAEAATEYEGILTGLMKPTDAMTAAINGMGFATAEAAIEELGFVEVLRRLDEVTGGNSEKLGELFGRKQAILGISKLTADEMRVLSDAIDSVAGKTGMASDAYRDWTETGEALNKETKAVTDNLMILIGEALDPMMDTLQIRLIDIIKRIGEWVDLNPDLAATVAQITGGLGLFLIPFGALMMALPGLVIAIPAIIGFIGTLSTGFTVLAASLGLAPIALGLAIIGFGKLGIEIGKAWKEAREQPSWKEIGEAAERAAKSQATALEKLQKAYNLTNEELQYWIDNQRMCPRVVNEARREMQMMEADTRAMASATRDYVEVVKDEIQVVKEASESFEDKDSAIAKSLILGEELSEQQEEYMILRQRMTDIDRSATQRKIDDLDRECVALRANMETNLMTMEQIDEYRQVMLAHIVAESSERQDHLRNMEEIENKVFELTHTQTEVRIRDLELEREARLETAKQAMLSAEELEIATTKINDAYDREKISILELAIIRSEKEIAGLDETIEKRKEAGEYIGDLITKRDEEIKSLDRLIEAYGELGGAYDKLETGKEKLKFDITESEKQITFLNKEIALRMQQGDLIDELVKKRDAEIINLNKLKAAYSGAATAADKLATAEAKKPMGPIGAAAPGQFKVLNPEGEYVGVTSDPNALTAAEIAAGWQLVPLPVMGKGGLIKTFMEMAKHLVRGGSTDTVPIMATPGEYVIKKQMVDFIRRTGMVTGGLVEAIKKGLPTPNPVFAEGGMVGRWTGAQPGVIPGGASGGNLVFGKESIVINAKTLDDEAINEAGDKIMWIVHKKAKDAGLVWGRS